MSGQGVQTGWLRNVGCSKACSLQSMIRTTYPDRICYCPSVMFTSAVCFFLRESGQESAPHVLLGNPDGVDPDSHVHSVSPGRGVPTPCTRKRSPLWHSSFHPGRNSVRQHFTSGIPSADISHPALDIRMGEEDVSTSPIKHIRIL